MEVECKVRIDAAEADAIRARLDAAGAVAAGEAEQTDIYLHHPARDLEATDEAFRLREEGGVLELTYKGPRLRSDKKAREELNLRVDGDPMPLLRALGFRPAARLVKRRAMWRLDGCHVAVDHIDGLGWFVEVEADVDQVAPDHAIDTALERLGLAGRPAITDSYLGMALDAGAAGVETL